MGACPCDLDFFYSGILVISTYYGLFSILLYFVIPFRFIMKLSPLPVVFSRKGFHINLVFFLCFIFHYYVIYFNNKKILNKMKTILFIYIYIYIYIYIKSF